MSAANVFDPKKHREDGRAQGAWRRSDEYRQIAESGPPKLNPVFMRGPGNMSI
jgi:hypothetical protein